MDLGGVLLGVLLAVVGAGLVWVAWLGSQRRLPRNHLMGMRLRSTMRSEQAWTVAHEAAAGPLGIGGAISFTAGIGLVAAGSDDVIGTVLVIAAVVSLLVSVLIAAHVAVNAVKDAPDPG